jgi:hypothetical protein
MPKVARCLGLLGVAASLGIFGGCGDNQTTTTHVPGSGGGAGSGGAGSGGVNAGAAQTGVSGAGNAGVGVGGANNGGSGGVSGASSGGVSGGGMSTTGGAAGASGGACAAASSTLAPWPGKNDVKTLDTKAQFTSDLSGLTYEPGANAASGVLWAVNNLSGTLFRLVQSANGFAPDTANGWSNGKQLHFPDGKGGPDAEGVTFGANVADGVYVCSEHDTEASGTSRLSVLRYDVSAAGAELTASHEWNLTALLPKVGANAGLEAITWVPDTFLTSKGFFDDTKAHAYAPAEYANHGTGLFFVGVEETGKIHAFALNHTGSAATLVATIATPNPGVMGLEFDRDAGNLWFNCDDTCGNKSGVLGIDTTVGSATLGHFVVRRQFQRPSSLPDSNNEGIAIAPASECSAGFKRFFWTDDADQDGFSLRVDSIPCDACL